MFFKILILSLIAFIISQLQNKPIKTFWLSLMFYFDPGGFFGMNDEGNVISRIKYYDVFFIFMAISFFVIKSKTKLKPIQNETKHVFNLLLPIFLYFIIINGFLIPYLNNYADYAYFIQKNRQFLYALPILYFCYHTSNIDVKPLYKLIVWFSTLVLLGYLFTIATNINMVPVIKISRYGENDRVFLLSYGLFHLVLPLGIVILSLLLKYKLKIEYKNILIFGMVLMLTTTLLTLTKREYLRIFFICIGIPALISYFTKRSIIRSIKKYIIPTIIIVLGLSIVFPKNITYTKKLIEDIYSIGTKGYDTEGNIDSRISGTDDYLIVKRIISENFIWGIGYYPANWSKILNMKSEGDELGLALDASSEVPIYGALMRLGILGLIIPLILYFYLIYLIFQLIKFIRRNIQQLVTFPIELGILITLLFTFITKFILEFYNLFGEFYLPDAFGYLCTCLGITLGIFHKFKHLINKQSVLDSTHKPSTT